MLGPRSAAASRARPARSHTAPAIAAAATTAPASYHERNSHRGPIIASTPTATTATKATCGLDSHPRPDDHAGGEQRPAAARGRARISSQRASVVLSRSKVVVVTKCPVASANPDDAVQSAAITWARAATADLPGDERRDDGRRRGRQRRRQPQHAAASPAPGHASAQHSNGTNGG